jgi:hypothetical protein
MPKTFPEFVPPMMAESARSPFDYPDWIFEIKLDGYRAITVFDVSSMTCIRYADSGTKYRNTRKAVVNNLYTIGEASFSLMRRRRGLAALASRFPDFGVRPS